jgi:hypothetical protein
MANYLTQADVDNYGNELLDVSQRAAMQAVEPYLAQLNQQHADLRARHARDRRRVLDQEVAAAVPNYREVDRDPAWHRWLLGVDLMSGRIRQALLNEAINSGDARRVELFFRQFQQQEGGSPQAQTAPGRRPRSSNKPIYTRQQISKLYDQHRRGAYNGREAEWQRQEADIIAAGREGRVVDPVFDVYGK